MRRYLYDGDKVVLEEDGQGNETARNVFGTNLLQRTDTGSSYYYMYNGHGDVTALLTTDGQIPATYYYDAFGNITEQTVTGSVYQPVKYAGYYFDDETGLYYLNARYYDPKIARFLSEDTYKGQANDPLSLNLYTYCFNNPLIYIDPTGNAAVKVVVNGTEIKNANAVETNGKTVVNLRQAAEALGCKVDWNSKTNQAVVSKDGKTLGSYDTTNTSCVRVPLRDLVSAIDPYKNVSYSDGSGGSSATVTISNKGFLETIGTAFSNFFSGNQPLPPADPSSYRKSTNNISKNTPGSNNQGTGKNNWIPSTVLDFDGSSDAANYFRENEKNFTTLHWDQDKLNALWQSAEEINDQYGIQVDPRFLLAIIIQEGTGSFNTSSTNRAADGQHGVETNYAVDLMKANSLVFGKILGYINYGEEFRQAVLNNNDKAGINGNGNIFQYCNWNTPIIDTRQGKVRTGPYAGHGSWASSVKTHYIALGGDANSYENYISSIDKSVIENIVEFKLPEYRFVVAKEAQNSKGIPNGEYIVKGIKK